VNLSPIHAVRKNIALPLEITDPTEASRDQRIVSLVRLIGLEGFEDTYPSDLSGGMAQRVAIARALVHEPDLLLLDEPFGSLDALTRERMGSELLRIWHARPATVIMVTHSIQESLLLADRVIVLSDRPARVLLDQTVPLPRPRSLDMSYSKDFVELAAKIRNLLSFQNKSAPEAQTA
jgi:NitT/TauT family transport system ATP-binding protein